MDLNPTLAQLSTVLRVAGAVSATAEYAGYGDSGNHFEIAIQWPANPAGNADTTEPRSTTSDSLDCPDFDARFEHIVWDAVSAAGHDGWENNEGGGGTFIVHADATASLEHYDNFTDTVNNSYIFGTGSHDMSEEG